MTLVLAKCWVDALFLEDSGGVGRGKIICDVITCKTLGGHMSILVTTTKMGTLSAKARPKCSLVMPTMPALAPIINIPKSETKLVQFYRVSLICSLRYR